MCVGSVGSGPIGLCPGVCVHEYVYVCGECG